MDKNIEFKKRKALLVGFFCKDQPFNGETTKAVASQKLLEKIYGEVTTFNTEGTKKHPIKAIFGLRKVAKNADDIFLCVSVNGFTRLTKLLSFWFPKKRLYFLVVGQGPIFKGVQFPEGDKNTLIEDCIQKCSIPYEDKKKNSNERLLRKHRAVFYESEVLAELYKKYFGLNNEVVLTNFRDLPIVSGNHSPFNEGKNTSIVFFSRIAKEKGIFDLVEVTKELIKEGHPFSLTIAGNGNDENVSKLKSMVDGCENIKYIGPVKTNPQAFLASFDAQVLSTHREGISGSLVESLFAGTPILCSSFACSEEIVAPGCGIIFERGNKAALKKALLDYINLSKEEKEKMSERCLEHAKKFTEAEGEKILRAKLEGTHTKFLRKHCQMAWEMAVNDCKLICDGLTDVTQRKRFVSSFTNALELGFKQILIDDNNKKVIDRKRLKKKNWSLYKRYAKDKDLNSFFKSLSSDELDQLYSANISNIVKTALNGIADKNHVNKQIKALLNLRNKETHFYIDETNYMSFDEFKDLCDLMKRIQTHFIDKDIIDHMLFGTPRPSDKLHASYFDLDISSISTYEELVIMSETNTSIAKQFPLYEGHQADVPDGWIFDVDDASDLYSIAFEIYSNHGMGKDDIMCMNFSMGFNEFYRRFLLMVENSMLNLEPHDEIHSGKRIQYVLVSMGNKSS